MVSSRCAEDLDLDVGDLGYEWGFAAPAAVAYQALGANDFDLSVPAGVA